MTERRTPGDVTASSLRLRWFPSDGSAVWLPPKELAIAAMLLEARRPEDRAAVEIGVFRGAWSVGVLRNVDGVSIVGVDPFPGEGGDEIRADLEARIALNGLGDRFSLVTTRGDADVRIEPGSVALIHVDGEHTEAAVDADLRWCDRMLSDDGVVVMDDYLHPWFPGISSAMHEFLRAHRFRMLMATEQKAYLCRSGAHGRLLAQVEDRLRRQTEVPWSRHFLEGEEPGYVQRPDVLGAPVLLLLGYADVLPLPGGRRSRRVGEVARRRRLAGLLDDWLPPAAVRGLRRLYRALRPTGRTGPR